MTTLGGRLRRAFPVSESIDRLLSGDLRDGHSGSPEVGPLASILFISGGLLAVLTEWALPDHTHVRIIATLGGIAILAGVVIPLFPWTRWPRWAALSLPFLAHVLLALLGWLTAGALLHYLVLYVLCYVYLGLTQRQGTGLLFVPVTVASLAVGSLGLAIPLVDAISVTVVGVVVAEVVAATTAREMATQRSMTRLLAATRQLLAAESVDGAAAVLNDMAGDLLGADGSSVFVVESIGSSRFVHRRSSDGQHQLDGATVDVAVETSGIGAAVHTREIVFVPGASAAAFLSRRLTARVEAESVVFVPLVGPCGPMGCLVVWWRQPVRRLEEFARTAVELLSVEAGRMLDTLAAKEHLAIEAATDALTGLANRRACQEALDASEAGDAFVMLDLDRFKDVNDTHGHPIGDDVLRTFADCVRSVARSTDCVARFGGDEFAVVLRRPGETGVRDFLLRLSEAWARMDPLTTYSVGVAHRTEDEGPLTTLGRADTNLYATKARTRVTS